MFGVKCLMDGEFAIETKEESATEQPHPAARKVKKNLLRSKD